MKTGLQNEKPSPVCGVLGAALSGFVPLAAFGLSIASFVRKEETWISVTSLVFSILGWFMWFII